MAKPTGLAGMEFDGWWTEVDGGSKVTSDTVVPVGLSEITYYAHWIGVIHYEIVNIEPNPNLNQVCVVDGNGVASGFYGETSTGRKGCLISVEDDKFDFSGDFTIVMKCKRPGDGGK